MPRTPRTLVAWTLALAGAFAAGAAPAHEAEGPPRPVEPAALLPGAECVGGFADNGVLRFPCHEVDLLAWVRPGAEANDIWGWTDPVTGHEIAIIGHANGVSFVDLADPRRPRQLGELPTATIPSRWADIKTLGDHAFVVRDAAGDHGLQVFDLSQLRSLTQAPVLLAASQRYLGFGNAHNLAIDEASGFAFAVGSTRRTVGLEPCGGGLHAIDLRDPHAPRFAGCWTEDRYVHDTQCVTYRGPDAEHRGREICFNSAPRALGSQSALTIVDVSDTQDPVLLARQGYAGSAYAHQGWLSEDQRYFLLCDELDERSFGHGTRTRVFDVSDLDAPVLAGETTGSSTAIDHNVFVHRAHAFLASYTAGVRVLRPVDLASGRLEEVAFFDTHPSDDDRAFSGVWGVYPFFASGVVVASDIEQGLFVLRPHLLRDVAIDVRPGTPDDAVAPRSRGRLRVALLGAEGFDVAGVDLATLVFGPAGAPPAALRQRDANRDGRPDLLLDFELRETGIAAADERACLSGRTLERDPFAGCDAIRPVGRGATGGSGGWTRTNDLRLTKPPF